MTQQRHLATGSTDADSIRVESFRGREYTVVPVVALVEGVIQGLNASEAEFASADEFARYPVTWNGRPVTLQHPTNNGVLCSANTPSILEEFQIGFMANTIRDGNKLKTEAWLDEELVTSMGDDAIQMLERIKGGEEFVEVSTGLFTEVISARGTFNGRSYGKAWTGVVPDHLAFLPDTIGACSVADGCGVPRLNAKGENKGVVMTSPVVLGKEPLATSSCGCTPCQKGEGCMSTNQQEGGSDGSGDTGTASPSPAEGNSSTVSPEGSGSTEDTVASAEDAGTENSTPVGAPGEEEILEALEANERAVALLDKITANSIPDSLVHHNARDMVRDALNDVYGKYSYVIAMTSNQVAFEHYDADGYSYDSGSIVAVDYSIADNGSVTFTGKPVPVNLLMQITPKPTTATVTANEDVSGANQQQEEDPMAGNSDGGQVNSNTEAVTQNTQTGGQQADGENRVNGAGNTPVVAAEPRSLAQYLEEAPPELREMLEEGIDMRNNQRNQLIADIVANSNGLFTEEELGAKKLDELKKLNTLSAPKKDFSGRAVPTGRVEGINANTSAEEAARQNSVPKAPKAFPERTIADAAKNASGNADASVAA
jgi:hypothetical protein